MDMLFCPELRLADHRLASDEMHWPNPLLARFRVLQTNSTEAACLAKFSASNRTCPFLKAAAPF